MKIRLSLVTLAAVLLWGCPDKTTSNPDAGGEPPAPDAGPSNAVRAVRGLDYYAEQGCAACHCNNAEGGCNVDAPGIQGISRDALNANLRFATTADEFPNIDDPFDPHPVKLPAATDEDLLNLAVFLGTLNGGVKIEADSYVSRGYELYISGQCISCHLTSAQGVNQGGLGQAIAGIDPDNIYSALAGGVPCHPMQLRVPTTSSGVELNCSILGRYVTDNETVRRLTDVPPPGADDERSLLAYFLAFIAPPPNSGVVEPCMNRSGEICTAVGNGIGGFTGDDKPAAETLLYYPQNLEMTDWNKDGTPDLAIVDWNNHRIRIVFLDKETEGVRNRIITIAGDGKVTGTDALNHPTDVAFDANGNLLVATWHNQNVIRYINGAPPGTQRDQPAGICDLACFPADDGSPQRVFGTGRGTPLGLPVGIEVLPDGRIVYAENNCARIRILDIQGTPELVQPDNCIDPVRLFSMSTLTTLAGQSRVYGYSGDEGPGRMATFRPFPGPTQVNFGISLEKGPNPRRLYVADSLNNIIRYVDITDGTVHHFSGKKPVGGDNPMNAGFRDGSKDEALFNFPIAVYAHTDGNVYVSDGRNHAVRKVDRQGTVNTIAGTGRAGFNGDNIPATSAQLSAPGGVVIHPDGRIFISDTNNNRIRVIVP